MITAAAAHPTGSIGAWISDLVLQLPKRRISKVILHIEFAAFATAYLLIEVPILLAAAMLLQRRRSEASLCQTRSA